MATLTLKSEEMEQFPTLVRDFATYKAAISGCSEKTVCEYLLDLRTFFKYLEARRLGIPFDREYEEDREQFDAIDIRGIDIETIRKIRTETIYEFLLYAGEERSNGWAAKSRKLSALKAFFKYLTTKRNLLEINPCANIESPKKRSSLPKYLSLSESVELLSTIKNDSESKTVVRDYAIVCLFLNCGMRLSELVGIDINHIDPQLRSLRVLGKGSKERIVYLNEACRAALADYIKQRLEGDTGNLKTRALFLSGRDQRISNKTVQWMVYKYLRAAGLDGRGYSVHKLRHTAATLMYQTGNVDVRVLKDILGHEQLNTTQIYTHVSDKNMENAVNTNPLAGVKIKRNIKAGPEDKEDEE